MSETKGSGLDRAWSIFGAILVKKHKAARKSDGTYVIEQEAKTRDTFLMVLVTLGYATKEKRMELIASGERICEDPLLAAGEWEAIYREVARNMRWKIA